MKILSSYKCFKPSFLFLNSAKFCNTQFKLPFGQGGQCKLNLTKHNYNIKFETHWQDFCLVNIKNKPYDMVVEETGKQAILKDGSGTVEPQKQVQIQFKIPEDYTFTGNVNGNVLHTKSSTSNKLRCKPFKLNLQGNKRLFQWGSIQCPNPQINVPNGAIDISSLTFQNGTFKCHSFSSQKVLFSGIFQLQTEHLTHIRSIVTYGPAMALIISKYVQIQSISGIFGIKASQSVKIDRLWASKQGIKIKCKKIQKIGIETGTGSIETQEPIDQTKVTLGRLHKGKINKISQTKLIIQ